MSFPAGNLSSAAAVERAALVALKGWLPKYVPLAAKYEGVKPNLLEPVKSWAVSSEYELFPESDLPAIIISSEGLLGPPRKDGAGFYTVTRSLEVSITIAAATAPRARLYSQIYVAAIAGAILQRRSLGNDMCAADWLDEANGTHEKTGRKTVCVAASVFAVEHRNVVNWRKGPKDDVPPDEIPETNPIVTDVDVKTEVEE